MTSVFWFQYKPSDEREEALLSKARWAALTFLWTTLSILFAITVVVSENAMLPAPIIMLSILAIEFGSYFAGWWVIRHEVFEDRFMPRVEKYSLMRLLITLTFTSVILVGLVALFPALYYVFGTIWFISPIVLLAFFTWKQAPARTTAIRILLTVFAPFTFGYLRSSRTERSIRVCQSIAFFLFWMIITIIPILFVRGAIAEPTRVTTDRFVAQGFNQGWTYVIDKTVGYHEADIVITEEKNERWVRQIIRIDESSIVYIVDGVEYSVPKSTIIGTLLADFPMRDFINTYFHP